MSLTSRRLLLMLLMLSCVIKQTCAFSWHDLWATKDQQAKAMMDKGEFKQAKETFLRDDWRAVSAYRAKDYEQAEKKFRTLDGEEAYYNQGNALAQMKQYEKAIGAYDKTLRINPEHKDALHNRKIVEDLLKKEQQQKNQDKQDQDKQDQDKQDQDKQNQDKQNQDKQDQDKQDQDKQDQDKQDQDKQDQDKQDQDKQDQDKQDQDKQDQDKQDQDKQDQDKQDQDKQDQDKQDQDKQDQDKQDQDKQDQDKQDQDKQDQDKKNQSDASAARAERENQQAKDQWLRLIPDDPGGLLREKFRRDHLRRQQGWGQ